MKRAVFLFVICLLILSCDNVQDALETIGFDGKTSVHIKNDCAWQISVCLTEADTADSYTKINSGDSYYFGRYENKTYNIIFTSILDSSTYRFTVKIGNRTTYTIDWDIGKGGYILK